MSDIEENLSKVILTRLVFLNKIIIGIVTGIILGGGICLATIFLIIKGGTVVGPHLELLGQFFIGYKVTYAGSIVGLVYGFVMGFIIGYSVSSLYNWLASFRSNKHERR